MVLSENTSDYSILLLFLFLEHEEGPEEDDITTDSMIMESKLEAQSSDVTNESSADKQQDDGKRTSAGNDEIMV